MISQPADIANEASKAAKAAAPLAATAHHTKNKNSVPAEEQPILTDLYKFRHSLQVLRKATHGALTLADVDVKANELAAIMQRLRDIRMSELDCTRNRVDDVLDSIWMLLFYIWGKIAGIDESLYPTYVALVSLSRQTEALRLSGAWTTRDVQPLSERARELEEEISSHGGRFLDPTKSESSQSGDRIPHGQAVLASLLNRVHRSLGILNSENDLIVEHLKPTLHELNSILHELETLEMNGGFVEETLAPYADRLWAIEASRGPTGRFNAMPSEADPVGQATCAGILNLCFDKLHSLQADLDPVVESSPLKPIHRSLLEIHTNLTKLVNDPVLRRDPHKLSEALEPLQHSLESIEKRRTHGTFVPVTDVFDDSEAEDPMSVEQGPHATTVSAAALPGQATLHKLQHACHALITRLVDPLSRPVSEALVSTYEILESSLAKLRHLRSRAATGRKLETIRGEVEEVEGVLEKVEAQKVKGLFMGAGAVAAAQLEEGNVETTAPLDFEALAWLAPHGHPQVVPDGQAVVSALMDECDSLVWEIRCFLARHDIA
ncbi:hypothetical protein HDU76_001850 [Blyttiomyces sp. JEL0837]|nr:hypothetical protein HDU76_001850 [Blyttiomyces sp. JEL0837]